MSARSWASLRQHLIHLKSARLTGVRAAQQGRPGHLPASGDLDGCDTCRADPLAAASTVGGAAGQEEALLARGPQERDAAAAVVRSGRRDSAHEKPAECVGEHTTLAPDHTLGGEAVEFVPVGPGRAAPTGKAANASPAAPLRSGAAREAPRGVGTATLRSGQESRLTGGRRSLGSRTGQCQAFAWGGAIGGENFCQCHPCARRSA